MRRVRLHPRVYDDVDDALAYTRERFGPRQVSVYERLIVGPIGCVRGDHEAYLFRPETQGVLLIFDVNGDGRDLHPDSVLHPGGLSKAPPRPFHE